MSRRSAHLIGTLCFALSCGDFAANRESESSADPIAAAAAAVISQPSGYARYCSKASASSWDFVYNPSHPKPCVNASGPTSDIRRAGLWDNRAGAYNRVVVTCQTLSGSPVRNNFYGLQDYPLADAHSWATSNPYSNCVFTVAPKDLAIFQPPMSQETMENIDQTGNGVDLAYGVDLFYDGMCMPAPGTNKQVDYRGHGNQGFGGAPYFPNNSDGTPFNMDHSGYDWVDNDEWADPVGNAANWSIFSPAEGTVVKVRTRHTPAMGPSIPGFCTAPGPYCQLEVFIKHTVGPANGDYREEFLTYYAHMDSTPRVAGDVVAKGGYIGLVGATGCGPCQEHLHFAVFRLTNTASEWRVSALSLLDSPSGGEIFVQRTMIDPFGYSPNCADPWGAKFADRGALSIDLWEDTYGYLDWDHDH